VNKPMSDSKSFEVLTAKPCSLSSSPARSYRSWSDEEKARIVEQTNRRWLPARMCPRLRGQMGWIRQRFTWRRKAIASGVVTPLDGSPSRPVRFTRFEAMRTQWFGPAGAR
jgi:transposase